MWLITALLHMNTYDWYTNRNLTILSINDATLDEINFFIWKSFDTLFLSYDKSTGITNAIS